jgi:hypothetical protein
MALEYLSYENRHEIFLWALWQLISEGLLEVLPQGFESDRAVWMVRGRDAIFIPKRTVADLLKQQHAPRLSDLAVTEQLSKAGILLGEEEMFGKIGWLIKDDAWSKVASKYRNRKAGLLGLYA